MTIHPDYKKPKITSGNLKTPVVFFKIVPKDGPEPGETEEEILFESMCLAYNPSLKDMEILNVSGTKMGLTIKIRDPHEDYIPQNKDSVKIDDYRFEKTMWEIKDVAPDFENNAFIKIVLGATS